MSRELAESSGLSKPGVGAQEVNACSMRTAGCGHMTQLSPGSRHMAADVRGAARVRATVPARRGDDSCTQGCNSTHAPAAGARTRSYSILDI